MKEREHYTALMNMTDEQRVQRYRGNKSAACFADDMYIIEKESGMANTIFGERTWMHDPTKPLIYAGIGARLTPPDVCDYMQSVAHSLDAVGWTLRSGGAKKGADAAFERGAMSGENRSVQIFRGKDVIPDKAFDIASSLHPAWHACDAGVRKLHGRNIMIILGADLVSPVQFVVCSTLAGKTIGGTGLGLACAFANGIRTFNLAIPQDEAEFKLFMKHALKDI